VSSTVTYITFLTNVFNNIIRHLFARESHQVVKITVTYPTCMPTSSTLPDTVS
jgi:hypothetical protein